MICALYPTLENKGQPISHKIHQKIPGYQSAVAVGILYNLQIRFQVQQ